MVKVPVSRAVFTTPTGTRVLSSGVTPSAPVSWQRPPVSRERPTIKQIPTKRAVFTTTKAKQVYTPADTLVSREREPVSRQVQPTVTPKSDISQFDVIPTPYKTTTTGYVPISEFKYERGRGIVETGQPSYSLLPTPYHKTMQERLQKAYTTPEVRGFAEQRLATGRETSPETAMLTGLEAYEQQRSYERAVIGLKDIGVPEPIARGGLQFTHAVSPWGVAGGIRFGAEIVRDPFRTIEETATGVYEMAQVDPWGTAGAIGGMVVGGFVIGKISAPITKPIFTGIRGKLGLAPKPEYVGVRYLADVGEVKKGITPVKTLAVSKAKMGKIQADVYAMFKAKTEPMKPKEFIGRIWEKESPVEKYMPKIERFTEITKTTKGFEPVVKAKIKFPETAMRVTEPEMFYRKVTRQRRFEKLLGREPIVTVEKATERFGGKGVATEVFKFPEEKVSVSLFREKGYVEPYMEAKYIPKKAYDPMGKARLEARYKTIQREMSETIGISRMKRIKQFGFEDAGGFMEEQFVDIKGMIRLKPKAKITRGLETEILTPKTEVPIESIMPSESQFMRMEASMKQTQKFIRPTTTALAKESVRAVKQMEAQIFTERVSRVMGVGVAIPKAPIGVAQQVELVEPQVTPRGAITIQKPVSIMAIEEEISQFRGIYPVSVPIRKFAPLVKQVPTQIQPITPIRTPAVKTPTLAPPITPTKEITITELEPPYISTMYPPHVPKIPAVTPFLPLPIGLGGVGRRRRRRKRKKRKQPKKYRPSLTAIVFGIRGKQPKFVTGLGIRPMKRRKRKVRRKKRRKKRR